jgi:hypothetical protein
LLGLGGNEAYGAALQNYKQSPFLAQLVSDTTNAVDASRAARGGLFSGGTAQEIGDRAGQLYLGDFNNYLSRLGGLTDTGQNAAVQTGNAGRMPPLGRRMRSCRPVMQGPATTSTMANGVNNALGQGMQLYGAYKGGMFDKPPTPGSAAILSAPGSEFEIRGSHHARTSATQHCRQLPSNSYYTAMDRKQQEADAALQKQRQVDAGSAGGPAVSVANGRQAVATGLGEQRRVGESCVS